MLDYYYNRISHLRFAKPILDDIEALKNVQLKFYRPAAINTISRISLKYEKDLQKIGFYLSGRPIIKGETRALYANKTDDDVMDDLTYLINCLIVIGAVKFNLEPSLEAALKKVQEEY